MANNGGVVKTWTANNASSVTGTYATPIYDKYLNLVEPLKGGMRQVFSIISCRKIQ